MNQYAKKTIVYKALSWISFLPAIFCGYYLFHALCLLNINLILHIFKGIFSENTATDFGGFLFNSGNAGIDTFTNFGISCISMLASSYIGFSILPSPKSRKNTFLVSIFLYILLLILLAFLIGFSVRSSEVSFMTIIVGYLGFVATFIGFLLSGIFLWKNAPKKQYVSFKNNPLVYILRLFIILPLSFIVIYFIYQLFFLVTFKLGGFILSNIGYLKYKILIIIVLYGVFMGMFTGEGFFSILLMPFGLINVAGGYLALVINLISIGKWTGLILVSVLSARYSLQAIYISWTQFNFFIFLILLSLFINLTYALIRGAYVGLILKDLQEK